MKKKNLDFENAHAQQDAPICCWSCSICFFPLPSAWQTVHLLHFGWPD